MGKKTQNIYEYSCDYTEKEINDLISDLPLVDQELIKDRYGEDLHNPVRNESFTQEKKRRFYSYLIPKMKKLLAERHNNDLEVEVEDKKDIVVEASDNEDFKLDLNLELIELINNKISNREICDKFNINQSQLHNLLLDLKNKGVMLSKKYYSDGSIQYGTINNFPELKRNGIFEQDNTLITDLKESNLKFLLLSDLHFGNELENKELIDRAFNYCIKNNINIILCGGDLIDGTFTKGEQRISDVYKQIEYFVNNYPHDKNILTFSVGGDHDLSAFSSYSMLLMEVLNNYRHDVVMGGYNNAGINIKNDQILLYHHIATGSMRSTPATIILVGHCHKYVANLKYNTLNVLLPSASDINESLPSVLELETNFDGGYIKNATIKQIYFGDKDIVLSEATFPFSRSKTMYYEPIKNVELYKKKEPEVKEESKQLVKTIKPLSQVEKFYKRYGMEPNKD